MGEAAVAAASPVARLAENTRNCTCGPPSIANGPSRCLPRLEACLCAEQALAVRRGGG